MGLNYTNSTGCPVQGQCNFGYNGIGYIGGDQSLPVGGYPMQGSANVTATLGLPCYISLVNFQQNNLNVQLSGQNILAFFMTIDFPYNYSNYTNMTLGQPYLINSGADLAYLYIGSTNSQSQPAVLSWKQAVNTSHLFKGALQFLLAMSTIVALL